MEQTSWECLFVLATWNHTHTLEPSTNRQLLDLSNLLQHWHWLDGNPQIEMQFDSRVKPYSLCSNKVALFVLVYWCNNKQQPHNLFSPHQCPCHRRLHPMPTVAVTRCWRCCAGRSIELIYHCCCCCCCCDKHTNNQQTTGTACISTWPLLVPMESQCISVLHSIWFYWIESQWRSRYASQLSGEGLKLEHDSDVNKAD